MGSYTSFSVGGYDLYSTKSHADPRSLTVFTEADRFQRYVKRNENDEYQSVDESDEDSLLEVKYATSVKIVRDRLELMGFDLASAQEAFELALSEKREQCQDWIDRAIGTDLTPELPETQLLKQLTFEAWLDALRDLKVRSIHSWDVSPWSETKPQPEISPLQEYMFSGQADVFNFPYGEFRTCLRLVLEVCDDNDLVELDLTDVINGGYIDDDEQNAKSARQELLADIPSVAPIIVLTEGSTDGYILSQAMELLRPHLSEYYSFMDFAGFSAPGGTTQLIANVKAFAGAGIGNRIIALFDNDTAGRLALQNLQKLTLPATVVASCLPDITLGITYPTIGPSGTVNMNVNGFAGSIELYFGTNILNQQDGSLTPVQWRGYESSMGAYQGELLGKAGLLQKFKDQLSTALREPAEAVACDWSGMEAILDTIQHAFDDVAWKQPNGDARRVFDLEKF